MKKRKRLFTTSQQPPQKNQKTIKPSLQFLMPESMLFLGQTVGERKKKNVLTIHYVLDTLNIDFYLMYYLPESCVRYYYPL